jgi:hypothetical protein
MAPVPLPPAAPRRGMSPVVLVLLIVFGLIFLGFIGIVGFGIYAARAIARNPGLVVAKVLTAANPNLQVLSTNNSAGTLTVRDKTTGQVSTITFDQAKNGGHFSISGTDEHGGTASFQFGGSANDMPGWVPKYPGATNTGLFSAKGTDANGKGEGGSFTFNTTDPASKVLEYYKGKAGDLGMKVGVTTDTPTGGMIVASEEGDKRTLTVIANTTGASTGVNVSYAEKQ